MKDYGSALHDYMHRRFKSSFIKLATTCSRSELSFYIRCLIAHGSLM